MIESFGDYANEILSDSKYKSVTESGSLPTPDELVDTIDKLVARIKSYKDSPLIRSSDFYNGYISGVSDTLSLLGWNPWLVNSFVNIYLTIRFTDKYLVNDSSDSWQNSLSKSLNRYYDDEATDMIISNIDMD